MSPCYTPVPQPGPWLFAAIIVPLVCMGGMWMSMLVHIAIWNAWLNREKNPAPIS